MRECLLNFVQDLFKFPWTREEFLRCNSFRESYDVFHDRIGDCSFEEYVEFFKEFNLECSTLEKSIDKLSDEQLEQISGGGAGRFIAIPMVALTLLSGVSSVTGFAASIKAPKAVSFQADAKDEIQDEWEKTRDFVARAGDPWLSMLPLENEPGFDEYTNPEIDFDEEESKDEKVVSGKKQDDGIRENVYPQIYEIVQNFMDYANKKKGKGELPEDLGKIVADADKGNWTQELPGDLRVAKYIYVWIAKNMKYDRGLARSIDVNEREYRAMPGVVFERRDGVCAGFARLARLMMRMAKIPCAYVGSPMDRLAGGTHAFNAVYVEKTHEDGTSERGWTLMDATWGMQEDVEGGESAEKKEKRLHEYFPAAYDNESLKEDNSSMMHNMSHQARYIENYNSYILNGVKYTVNDDSISVSSEKAGARLSLQVPDSILALNRKIKIGSGIGKYKCSGNERIDISKATNLESIDTYDSDVYDRLDEEGVLYYREDRSVADLKPGATVVIDRVKYYRDPNDCHSITVSSKDSVSPFLQVPPDLALNSKIKIGSGIYSYKCSGDEKVDISGAWNLQSIDTEKSHIYKEFKDGVLYYRNGGKVAGLKPGASVVTGGFRYLFRGSSVYVISPNPQKTVSLTIPPEILALGSRIVIGPGIKVCERFNRDKYERFRGAW